MTKAMKTCREKNFGKRFHSMMRADVRRMFAGSMFYIMLFISFAIPILMLVMTNMVDSENDTVMFANTWQIIASDSGDMTAAMGAAMGGNAAAAGAGMDMSAMMNCNMMYFLQAVFVCLFVAEDFRSGFAKNLFTVRVRKTDYVASKTVIGFFVGSAFLLAFFVGTIVGGAIAGLSFELGTAGVAGLVLCMIAKIGLTALFSSIFLLMSVIGKQRTWMSVLLSLFAGMLLFMMIPMMTPLNAGFIHVGLCFAGSAIFALSIGTVSNTVLKRSNLIG